MPECHIVAFFLGGEMGVNIYETLGFTLHRRCNAACSICCFESGPNCMERLDVKRIEEYINESRDIPDIKSIAFTGGEAFLEYDTLVDLIKQSHLAGKEVSVATNGFWASDYSETYKILENLKNCGLSFLSMSYDNYHRKFVEAQNIRNILSVCTKLDIPTSVAIVKLKNESVGSIIDELGDDIYTAAIKVGPCLPVGRAKKLFSKDKYVYSIDTCTARCAYGANMVVNYDGTIYPCCSQVIVNTGLGIGNFKDLSLREAMSKLKNNALLYFLRNKDMSFFVEYARKSLKMEVPDTIVNPCELCQILFAKENINKYEDFVMNKIKELKNHN